jgi:putative PIN family toxin of toxin-antitoxin system
VRIVADTNVIVSALVFGGVPRKVLELVDRGFCDLFYSEAIRGEVRRVLHDKFGWSSSRLATILPAFWRIGALVAPRCTVWEVSDDPDDDRILECALECDANFVISGDRHLLKLGEWRSVTIISPRQFLDIADTDI